MLHPVHCTDDDDHDEDDVSKCTEVFMQINDVRNTHAVLVSLCGFRGVYAVVQLTFFGSRGKEQVELITFSLWILY